MPPKKTSLADAMTKAAGKELELSIVSEAESTQKIVTPSRKGTKAISGHFPPEVARQLKQMALDNDRTIQNLLSEAIGDLFEKHGKPRLLE